MILWSKSGCSIEGTNGDLYVTQSHHVVSTPSTPGLSWRPMSQRTDSSQSDASSLHYHRCWWAWCRHNFYTKQELSNHVISEHVQKARPVRLQDIHALQTAEDSYWGSLDLGSPPTLPSNLLDQEENCTQSSSHHQGASYEPVASSIH